MTAPSLACESARRRSVPLDGLALAVLHHLVLDRPEAFTAALVGFLE